MCSRAAMEVTVMGKAKKGKDGLTFAERMGFSYIPKGSGRGLLPNKKSPGRGRRIEINIRRWTFLGDKDKDKK
jgi:hypothetical protein